MNGIAPGPVLFGYGNPSRGDDALGPLLLDRAEIWAKAHPGADLGLVADFQLQIEHAVDLHGRGVALFLDADASCPPPFRFRRIAPARDESYTTHELSPESVLHVFSTISGQAPPPAFVLSVRGECFELGAPLSPEAEVHAEAAWGLLQELMADPRPESWAGRVT
ncbi:MAG: hydrogenase maturation protease [Geothrix sp.]|nr:hydrogenase maturation protease [Geothrix sp.]